MDLMGEHQLVAVIQNNLELILGTFLFEFMSDEVRHRIKSTMSYYMDSLVPDTIREYHIDDTSEVDGNISFNVFYRTIYEQNVTVLNIVMATPCGVNRTSIIKHYIPTHNLIN